MHTVFSFVQHKSPTLIADLKNLCSSHVYAIECICDSIFQGGQNDIVADICTVVKFLLRSSPALSKSETDFDAVKSRGNAALKNESASQIQLSISLYTEALSLCPVNSKQLISVVLSNRR